MDIKEYRRRYYQKNKEKWKSRKSNKEYYREYYKKNIEKLRKYHREYKDRYVKQAADSLGITPWQLKKWGINASVAMQRSDRKCEICEITDSLVIHHKDNRGFNSIKRHEKPNNDVDNLMVLCIYCHGKLHNHSP